MSGEKRAGAGSSKSASAFRTISEASKYLDVPQHVLRFWETKFSQVKPMKRAGGRRYYRPEDIQLLEGIRDLLYDQGYTIKGVQKLLKEKGAKAIQQNAGDRQPAESVAEEKPGASKTAVAEPSLFPEMDSPAPGMSESERKELTALRDELLLLKKLLDNANALQPKAAP